MNEEQKKQEFFEVFSAPVLPDNNQNIVPAKGWQVKSWQIIAVIGILLFIFGLFMLFGDAFAGVIGIVVMFLFFVIFIPTILLKSKKHKEIGAKISIILGILIIVITLVVIIKYVLGYIEIYTNLSVLISNVIFFSLGFIPGIFLLIAGLYYYKKKV